MRREQARFGPSSLRIWALELEESAVPIGREGLPRQKSWDELRPRTPSSFPRWNTPVPGLVFFKFIERRTLGRSTYKGFGLFSTEAHSPKFGAYMQVRPQNAGQNGLGLGFFDIRQKRLTEIARGTLAISKRPAAAAQQFPSQITLPKKSVKARSSRCDSSFWPHSILNPQFFHRPGNL